MSHHKCRLISNHSLKKRSWTIWFVVAPEKDFEIGIHFGNCGMIEMRCYLPSNGKPWGQIQFEADGKYWCFSVEPCPTQTGMVRIARRLRLLVEDLGMAESMLEANGSFMSAKRRAEMERGIELMKKRLREGN